MPELDYQRSVIQCFELDTADSQARDVCGVKFPVLGIFEALVLNSIQRTGRRRACDGILLFKYSLTVDQAQQEERFSHRLSDPLKRWKLSPIDVKAREKYAEYGLARDAMLRATHNPKSPWTLVDFNDQRRGRLTLIRHRLDHIPVHQVPEILIEFPPLGHQPLREQFGAPLKPIAAGG